VRRLAPLLAVLLSTSGCFRAARAWQLRGELLEDELRAQRFTDPPEESLHKIGAHLALRNKRCQPASCHACGSDFCFELQASDGGTRVVPAEAWSEEAVRSVWQPLGAGTLAAALGPLDDAVERKLKDEEERFVPHFGGTFGVLAMVAPTATPEFGGGLRVGIRRWHLMELLSTVAAEYTWFGGPSPHQVGLMLGVELSRWSAFSERVIGAPDYSLSMFVVPTLRFGAAVSPGFRAGVGLHVNDISGGLSFPFFVELGGTGATPKGQLEPGFFFDVGFGL